MPFAILARSSTYCLYSVKKEEELLVLNMRTLWGIKDERKRDVGIGAARRLVLVMTMTTAAEEAER
jgi:hypothetical protein